MTSKGCGALYLGAPFILKSLEFFENNIDDLSNMIYHIQYDNDR